jgi:PAS domain S-box-containing protein
VKNSAMKNELHELFQLAAKYFIKQYKKEGGAQSKLADELGITQSYLSSVVNGSRSASLELYSRIAEKLYGPLDKFLAAGRRIKEGYDPLEEKQKPPEDPVENLIARLTYYVVDHQRIENELSELKQFYETIVENQPTGIIVTNNEHKIIYLNNYIKSLLSISVEEIMGQSPYDLEENISGLNIGVLKDKYQEAFEKQKDFHYKNIWVQRPNGEITFFSGAFIPMMQNGLFNGMLCTIYDTSTSHVLKKLLINTLDFTARDIGIGVAQQTSPGRIPQVYFINKKFRHIFKIQDIDASKVSFPDVNKIMSAQVKNSRQWLKKVDEDIKKNLKNGRIIITMKNNKKYEWLSNPLIDDSGYQWGRIVTVKEIKNTKKKRF